MKINALPDVAKFKEVFVVDFETGLLHWRKIKKYAHRIKIGDEAGSINANGYKCVWIDGISYMVHRIIWKWYHGEEPDFIDHINENKTDNRICNLRSTSFQQNQWNQSKPRKDSKSGIRGVHKQQDKWIAKIGIDGKRVYLGSFNCPILAHLRYQEAKNKRE